MSSSNWLFVLNTAGALWGIFLLKRGELWGALAILNVWSMYSIYKQQIRNEVLNELRDARNPDEGD